MSFHIFDVIYSFCLDVIFILKSRKCVWTRPLHIKKTICSLQISEVHVLYGGSMLVGSQSSLIVMQTTFVFFSNESGMQ